MELIGPFTFQAIRCFLAVVGLIPVIAVMDCFKNDGMTFWSRWKDKKLWKTGLLCGLPLFLACNLQQFGLVDVDAGKSGFLTAMYIVIVPIIGLMRKKPFSPMIPVSVVLAVCGLYCLTGMSGGLVVADLLLLGCALMFAVQITFVDIFANAVDAVRLSTIQALVCTVLSSIFMFILETPTWTGIYAALLPLIFVGCLSMGLSYTLQIVGQKSLDPSVASLIMSMESVFAVIAGGIIQKQWLKKWELVGCILVLVAVVISQLPQRKKKTA
jgi:drug/metabolite transporter (DMT)-like permease